MLCDICTNALQDPIITQYSVFDFPSRQSNLGSQVLHNGFSSLLKSLEAQCGLCHRIVHACVSAIEKEIFVDSFTLQNGVFPGSLTLRYRLAYESPTRRIISFLGFFSAKKIVDYAVQDVGATAVVPLFLAPEQIPLSSNSLLQGDNGINSRSMNILQSWIRNCRENHVQCKRSDAPRTEQRFARILDVGATGAASHVVLRPSEELPGDLTYATLSHSWGGVASEIPSLTTRTYDGYLRKIDIATLPRTFRDAIELARHLAIRYLWIDSLCIIQDSTKDWLHQAAVMGEIYRGSYLNIAATKSDNAHGGLFTSRIPGLVTPLRVGIWIPVSNGMKPSPESLPPLRIEGTSVVIMDPSAQQEKIIEHRLDLNAYIGNDNGQFDSNGHNFAESSADISLNGTLLCGRLQRIDHSFQDSSIDIKHLVDGLWQGKHPSSLRLEEGSTLVAAYTDISLPSVDLNECLRNEDGKFSTKGMGFIESATNVFLSNTTLWADLCKRDGTWNRDSIDIASIIGWKLDQLASSHGGMRKSNVFYDVDTNYYRYWSHQITGGKLSRRGWTIQERLLAPRVVHFAAQQLIWECVETKTFENHPGMEVDLRQPAARTYGVDYKSWDVFSSDLVQKPRQRELGLNYIWAAVKALYGRENLGFSKSDLARDVELRRRAKKMCFGNEEWIPTHPLIQYWSNIMRTYSSSQLTFPADRLLAISGLAKTMSMRTGIAYVAGLWAHQLPRQLLWNCRFAFPEMPDDYVAPTWSWAAHLVYLSATALRLDPILERSGTMDLIKILSVSLDGEEQDEAFPLGRLKGGYLRVRGRLLPISLKLTAWPRGKVYQSQLVEFWSGSTHTRPTQETFVLPVLFTTTNEQLPVTTPNSLLLESTGQKGVFRRIGIARLNSAYPLRYVVPQLTTAQKLHYEDDDENMDVEVEPDEQSAHPLHQPTDQPKVTPDPQQELFDKNFDGAKENDIQNLDKSISDFFSGLYNHESNSSCAVNNRASERSRTPSRFETLANTVSSHFSRKLEVDRPSSKSSKSQASNKTSKWKRRLSPLPASASENSQTLGQYPGEWGQHPAYTEALFLQAMLQGDSGRHFLSHMFAQLHPEKPGGLSEDDRQQLHNQLVQARKDAPKRRPKDVIGSLFYREVIEGDADEVRFGCFVFDIV